MLIIDPGHEYELAHVDGPNTQRLIFVKRFRGAANHEGTQNQEVLRALIHRTELLSAEMPSPLTDEILHHLRMALVLHEARALIRKVEKGRIDPARILTCPDDGHFELRETSLPQVAEYVPPMKTAGAS